MDLRDFEEKQLARAAKAEISGFKTIEDNSRKFALNSLREQWVEQKYDGPFFYSNGVSAVFVQSKNGNTGGSNPQDLGAGETDEHLIFNGLSRVFSDAVMAGARTVRGSNMFFSIWHPEMIRVRATCGKPRHPAQIIASGSGELDPEEFILNVPEIPVFIVTKPFGEKNIPAPIRHRSWIQVISKRTFREAIQELEKFRIQSISLIGGRALATEMVDEGLVKELYLTTSSKSGGEPNTPWYTGNRKPHIDLVLRKKGKGREKGVIFEQFILGTK